MLTHSLPCKSSSLKKEDPLQCSTPARPVAPKKAGPKRVTALAEQVVSLSARVGQAAIHGLEVETLFFWFFCVSIQVYKRSVLERRELHLYSLRGDLVTCHLTKARHGNSVECSLRRILCGGSPTHHTFSRFRDCVLLSRRMVCWRSLIFFTQVERTQI